MSFIYYLSCPFYILQGNENFDIKYNLDLIIIYTIVINYF